MFCKYCGKELRDNDRFCMNCGAVVDDNAVKSEDLEVSKEYKPIGMWGYIGYEILFALPVVGLILAIILSFAPENKNLKNFARSYFCWIIVGIILSIIMLIFVAANPNVDYGDLYKAIIQSAQ